MTQDRRRYKRYQFHAVALIKPKTGGDSTPVPTLTENISLSGIEFHSYVDIEENTPVQVEIRFTDPQGNPASVTVDGKIVWVSYRGDHSAMGVEFDKELSAENHPVLYRYYERSSETR